jgi:hypothetical protein
MAYSQFTLSKATTQFKLQIDDSQDLFSGAEAVPISDFLAQILERYVPLALAINTEKARSEMIIAPILLELRELAKPDVSLFSGVTFNVDRKQGLTGPCDFIICRSPTQLFITAPVLAIAEAKNENINRGMGQCVAEMVAAKLFNEREGNTVPTIFGAVTTGDHWKFLKLEEQIVYIDIKEYYLVNTDKILGILLSMIQ